MSVNKYLTTATVIGFFTGLKIIVWDLVNIVFVVLTK